MALIRVGEKGRKEREREGERKGKREVERPDILGLFAQARAASVGSFPVATRHRAIASEAGTEAGAGAT